MSKPEIDVTYLRSPERVESFTTERVKSFLWGYVFGFLVGSLFAIWAMSRTVH